MQLLSQEIEGLTFSNLTDEYPDYDLNTTYILETSTLSSASVVKYGNYYYRSVTDNNLGFPPDTNPTKWLKFGISNKNALLDLRAQSKSISVGDDLIVEFSRGFIEVLTLGYFEAESITIEHLDALGAPITELTQNIQYSVNDNVFDYWDYIYSDYTIAVDRTVKVDIPSLGSKIRVTFARQPQTNQASCGYLIGGQPVNMGDTLYGVGFNFNSYATKKTDDFGVLSVVKNSVQDVVDFETQIPSSDLTNLKRKIKEVYNDFVVFILDESDRDKYDNLVTFGVIEDTSLVLQNDVTSTISWSVVESI